QAGGQAGDGGPLPSTAAQVFPRFPGPAGGQEGAFGRVEGVVVPVGPAREQAALVEKGVVAAVGGPVGGGGGEAVVGAQRLPVGGEPVAKGRPAADECLVGDLHGLGADRQQPGRREPFQDPGGGGRVAEFRPRDPPADVLGAVAQRG